MLSRILQISANIPPLLTISSCSSKLGFSMTPCSRLAKVWGGKGGLEMRNCAWASRKSTNLRCAMDSVAGNCPQTCGVGCA